MSELLMSALAAKNAEDARDLAQRRALLAKAIKKKFGRKFAKRIVWEAPDDLGFAICSIEGVRFRGRNVSSYYGDYATIDASFGGDSWAEVSSMAALGQVLLERHERGGLDV